MWLCFGVCDSITGETVECTDNTCQYATELQIPKPQRLILKLHCTVWVMAAAKRLFQYWLQRTLVHIEPVCKLFTFLKCFAWFYLQLSTPEKYKASLNRPNRLWCLSPDYNQQTSPKKLGGKTSFPPQFSPQLSLSLTNKICQISLLHLIPPSIRIKTSPSFLSSHSKTALGILLTWAFTWSMPSFTYTHKTLFTPQGEFSTKGIRTEKAGA